MCDSKDEESPIKVMHNGIVVREFKYQPVGFINLILRHTVTNLEFFKQVLMDYCI